MYGLHRQRRVYVLELIADLDVLQAVLLALVTLDAGDDLWAAEPNLGGFDTHKSAFDYNVTECRGIC